MAKRFTFRLEPVLKVRKAREDEQKRVVADWTRQVDEARRVVTRWRAELSRSVVDAEHRRRRPRLDAGMAMHGLLWNEHLNRRIVLQEERVRGLADSLASARQELTRRAAEVKAIEKLRERRLAAHRLNEQRADRSQADELAVQMFLRTRARGGATVLMR